MVEIKKDLIDPVTQLNFVRSRTNVVLGKGRDQKAIKRRFKAAHPEDKGANDSTTTL